MAAFGVDIDLFHQAFSALYTTLLAVFPQECAVQGGVEVVGIVQFPHRIVDLQLGELAGLSAQVVQVVVPQARAVPRLLRTCPEMMEMAERLAFSWGAES